jgi:UPF0755 protein
MQMNRQAMGRGRRAADLARLHRRNLATVCTVAALLAPLAFASVYVIGNVRSSTTGNSDVVIDVQPGWTPVQVGDQLAKDGVITSSARFQQVAQQAQFTTYKAGRYVFVANSETRQALDTLRGGPEAVIPDIKLLLPPGLTLAQIADRVGKLQSKDGTRFLDSARFLEVAKSGVVRSRYEPAGSTSLEGLTWPDTYFIGANENEEQILRRIVDQFDKRADTIGLAAAGPANGMTPYQTVISASLIEAEAGSPADRPLISAVIVNRIKDGTPLQIDATLCYAKGGCPPVPTDADRKIDSPYNTYRIGGLPPTPIKTVSEGALQAALNPAAVSFRYYVSDKHGKTYYATTLAEHERNVAKARNVN